MNGPMPKRKDDDMEDEAAPFADIRKSTVLQEVVIFSDRELNPGRCASVLTQLFYVFHQGEQLDESEASSVFFGVTKLFQSGDPHLRRLVYLMLKELKVSSDTSLIAVACLNKDMNSKNDLFRGNAVRSLARIMESENEQGGASLVSQMDRFLRQLLVEKNPFLVSCVLLSGLLLFPSSSETIKRWINEIQEALQKPSKMVPFHALALLYKIKQNDKLALNKISMSLMKPAASSTSSFPPFASSPPSSASAASSSPLCVVLHIRITFHLLSTSQSSNNELLKFLFDNLHHKSPLVALEAAKSLCSLPFLQPVQLVPAVSFLQEMLSSSLSCQRFAAVRLLSTVVARAPSIIQPCAAELEQLINDSNRSIATLAITTLLKTGVEGNVDRLLKSLSSFLSDSSDDFKIILIDSILLLSHKFPHKFALLLNFLASALREEGGFRYKRAIVEAMFSILSAIPESSSLALEHFCEFIEDCEFPELSIRILDVLGEKGPFQENPQKFIRYIFNRVILETSSVRSAAVSALAKFGFSLQELEEDIVELLRRCLDDEEDEVREKAVFYLNLFEKAEKKEKEYFDPTRKDIFGSFSPSSSSAAFALPSLAQLEASLANYLEKETFNEAPFSLSSHLISAKEESLSPVAESAADALFSQRKAAELSISAPSASTAASLASPAANPYLPLLLSLPQVAQLGELIRSSSPIQLTEPETEYVVSCVKHVFPQHFLFQFNVLNNLEGHRLERVRVAMESSEEEEEEAQGKAWKKAFLLQEKKILFEKTGSCFVCFRRPTEVFQSSPFRCTLRFVVKEAEEEEGEEEEEREEEALGHEEDEYPLAEVEVAEGDFMARGERLSLLDFKRRWEGLTDRQEASKKYLLGLSNLQEAVNAVVELLSMEPSENSFLVPEGAASHAVNLTGNYDKKLPVLARAGFLLDSKQGVTLKVAVRSENSQVNQMLANAIR